MTEHPSPELVERLAQMNASTYGYDTDDEHEMDDLRAEAHDILEALGWPGGDEVPVWLPPKVRDDPGFYVNEVMVACLRAAALAAGAPGEEQP